MLTTETNCFNSYDKIEPADLKMKSIIEYTLDIRQKTPIKNRDIFRKCLQIID